MKTNYWDIGVLVLTGAYFNYRLNGGRDDSLTRATVGVLAGLGVAKYGPEVYNNVKDYVTSIDKDKFAKLGVGAVSGVVGYNLSDLAINQINEFRQKKESNIKP